MADKRVTKISGPGEMIIGVKGGGDLATGICHRLFKSGFKQIFIMETHAPTVLRRNAAFASAMFENKSQVEKIAGVKIQDASQIKHIWHQGQIPVLADPEWKAVNQISPHVLVDAILAKKNLGTSILDADLVIGLGPGFSAGRDVHLVIETQRGHDLGRIITQGCALANTSEPEAVMGISSHRLIRAPGPGKFISTANIGAWVVQGQEVGHVDGKPVLTKISGVIRGLVHDGTTVVLGKKIGDVDPRGKIRHCHTISDKARSLGGSVLEAILEQFNPG